MDEKEEKFVREALENSNWKDRKIRCLLRKALGDKTELEYMHGHVIDEDGKCVELSCELWAPHSHRKNIDEDVSMEWLETVADRIDCPAPQEGIDVKRPVYIDECPNCGNEDTWTSYCEECAMPLGG